MVCNVTSTTKGVSFASFMGCNVQIRREGALFSYLMGDNVQRRRENGFCVKLLGNLVGAKKWVPKMAASRKPNRMGIFCPKDHPRAECTFLLRNDRLTPTFDHFFYHLKNNL